MANVRNETFKKYGISENRFMELYHFCMQYGEWKNELNNCLYLHGVKYDAKASNKTIGSITEETAIRKHELKRKCELIEETAKEVDEILYKYILKAVTNKGITYAYLKTVMDIPCGKDMYYNLRRKFYCLLEQKKTKI